MPGLCQNQSDIDLKTPFLLCTTGAIAIMAFWYKWLKLKLLKRTDSLAGCRAFAVTPRNWSRTDQFWLSLGKRLGSHTDRTAEVSRRNATALSKFNRLPRSLIPFTSTQINYCSPCPTVKPAPQKILSSSGHNSAVCMPRPNKLLTPIALTI